MSIRYLKKNLNVSSFYAISLKTVFYHYCLNILKQNHLTFVLQILNSKYDLVELYLYSKWGPMYEQICRSCMWTLASCLE